MKTTDHNVENLRRSLRDEAAAMRARAKELDALATNVTKQIKSGIAAVHTFEYIGQEAISIITHRSSVHAEIIVRSCATLAAEAAVEWVEAQRVAELLESLDTEARS